MQIQCHGCVIYSNCNMNEYEIVLYYNKLIQAVAVNLASHHGVVTSMTNMYIIRFYLPTVIKTLQA